MQCPRCKEQTKEGEKFCQKCGYLLQPESAVASAPASSASQPQAKPKSKIGLIISVLVVVGFVGYQLYVAGYNYLNKDVIEKSDNAIEQLDKKGNYQGAINDLENVKDQAMGNDNKIASLKNLGYAYWGNDENEKALDAFQQALGLAEEDTYDFYLISAEIALLQVKPSVALYDFEKALEIDPQGVQANQSLGVFYLGVDEGTEEYIDYQKALDYSLKAYDIDGQETAKENAALAYFFMEDYDNALKLFLETNLEDKPYNNMYVGLIYLLQENDIQAKLYLQKALDLGAELEPELLEYLQS